jgi:hypothetical protein
MNRFLKGLKGHEIIVLQSCAGPVQGQNRVFPVRKLHRENSVFINRDRFAVQL